MCQASVRWHDGTNHARWEIAKALHLSISGLGHDSPVVQGLLAVGNGHAACGLMVVWAAGEVTGDGAFAAGLFAAFFATGFFAAFLAAGFFAAGFAATFFATFFAAGFLATAVLAAVFFAAGF